MRRATMVVGFLLVGLTAVLGGAAGYGSLHPEADLAWVPLIVGPAGGFCFGWLFMDLLRHLMTSRE